MEYAAMSDAIQPSIPRGGTIEVKVIVKRGVAMKTQIVEGPVDQPYHPLHYSGARASQRLCILVAKRTASLLHDAALTSLFHSYQVEYFEQAFGLFVSRAVPIAYALVCGSTGCSRLAAETRIIRNQWPFAKILVLRPVPRDLEDHLYDDTVAADCTAASLAAAFCSRNGDTWNQRAGWNTGQPGRSRIAQESDPTKAEPSKLPQPPGATPRGLPADESQEISG